MAFTALDLIQSAMRKIGVLAIGQTPSGDDGQVCFDELLRMVDSWGTQRNMVYSTSRNLFPLVAGQQVYQLGPGAPDWDTPRPEQIEYAGIVTLNNPAQPLELKLEIWNDQNWANEGIKVFNNTWPVKVYIEYSFPFITLTFWPVPSTVNQVALYYWVPLSQFTLISDPISFPPGYEDAIVYNLAMRIAPDWGATPSPYIASMAQQSYDWVKSQNVPSRTLSTDPMLRRRPGAVWNNYLGDYN